MKKLWIYLFVIILFTSCNREKKGEIYIEGNFPQNKNQTVYFIKAQQSQGPSGFYKAMDSAKVNNEGKFVFQPTIRGGDFYQIRDKNEYLLWVNDLYLRPGDSLHISETDLKAERKLTQKMNRFPEAEKKKYPSSKSIRWITEKPPRFISKVEKRYQNKQDFLKEYFKDFDLPEEVQKKYSIENRLETINLKLDYLENHNAYSYGNWHPIPLDSMSFIKPIPEIIKDTSWYFLTAYMECIKKYTTANYNTDFYNPLDAKKDNRAFSTKKAIIDTMYQGLARDIALSRLADEFWKYMPAMQDNFYKTAEQVRDYFKREKSRNQFYDYYLEKLNKFKRIKPGKPAPDITLPDTSGNMVSLSDFRGEYVYITFWGTWMKNFVSNLDAYRALNEEFKNNPDITMLYIALQPNNRDAKNAWNYFLSKYPFGGKHILASGMYSNPQIKPYLIEVAPVHVLVNPGGNLITPRAPGPDKAKETIYKLFNQRLTISRAD